jgi:hypothetical protein
MWRISFILLLLVPTLSWADPQIVFNTEYNDFGDVRSGGPLEYAFEFSNAGSHELVVGKVKAFT